MVTVCLASIFREAAGGTGRLQIEITDGTVGDLVEELGRRFGPGFRARLSDSGGLRPYVNLYVDGKDVRFTGGLSTPVRNGSRVDVTPAVAGG